MVTANKNLLGKGYSDIITGYTGVVVGVSHYLTGCDQVLLVPVALKPDGARHQGEWFDCIRLRPNPKLDLSSRDLDRVTFFHKDGPKGGPMTETPPPSA